MDISAEIAAIQAASQGSELRQPLVGALNKLNSGSLPAVTASDAGKILKVGANGWEVGEKSGYMPVPTATKQITENGIYDVIDFASAQVHVSGGGSSTLIPKTITQNGTYDPADDNADGYSAVDVNVYQEINDSICRNWDFTNPVNTRGKSSYTGSTSINGWQGTSGTTVNIVQGGITLAKGSGDFNLYQQLTVDGSDFNNKDITFSCLVNNVLFTDQANIGTSTGVIKNFNINNSGVWIQFVRDSSTQLAFTIWSNNASMPNDMIIQAIKAEFGNIQTLAKQTSQGWDLIKNQNTDMEKYLIRKCCRSF